MKAAPPATLNVRLNGLWLVPLLLLILAVVGLGFAIRVSDPDVLMHLRAGEWMITNHRVLNSDPFSATAAGHRWVAHEWLWELAVYQLYRLGDWFWLYQFRALLLTGTAFFAACWARFYGINWFTAIAGFLLVAPVMVPFAEIRPQLATFCLFAFTAWAATVAEKRTKILWVIPVVFLLWANVHGGFMIGYIPLLILGGLNLWYKNRKGFYRHFLPVLVLSLALPIINPAGIALYTFPMKVIGQPEVRGHLYEWLPSTFAPAFVPFWVLAFVTAVFAAWQVSKRNFCMPALAGLMFVAAVLSRRQIPLFCICAVPILGVGIYKIIIERTWRDAAARHALAGLTILFAILIWPLSMFCYGYLLNHWGLGLLPGRFPETPAGRLANLSGSGAIFNDYNDGGFLIWKVWPTWKVCIDGRADVYGPEILNKYQQIWAGQPGWEATLRGWGTSVILGRYDPARIYPKHNLYTELADNPRWKLVYWDASFIMYVRSDISLADSNFVEYRSVKPAETWRVQKQHLRNSEDWESLGADIRRAQSDDATNARANAIDRLFQRDKPAGVR